jgi:hypothetical protein
MKIASSLLCFGRCSYYLCSVSSKEHRQTRYKKLSVIPLLSIHFFGCTVAMVLYMLETNINVDLIRKKKVLIVKMSVMMHFFFCF